MKKTLPVFQSKPDVYADRLAKLTPEQRTKLRSWLSDPLFSKLLSIAATYKPSSNCAGCGSMTRDQYSDARANARLGEIRGWELYEAAIFLALNEPAQIKHATPEIFQPVDADWNRVSSLPIPSAPNGKKA